MAYHLQTERVAPESDDFIGEKNMENKLNIRTDNKWKNLLYGYQLPKSKRKNFDYIKDDDFDYHSFIKYHNMYFDVSEFQTTSNIPEFKQWDGYTNDTFFSGTLIKLSRDGEKYKIASFS